MQISSEANNFDVVSVAPISEEVKRLQVISCDLCSVGKASYDLFINGIIKEMSILKRCCDSCVKLVKVG